ncbi:MAG TPA: tetraacyldisaccharide 4'-kinase [Sulfurovum sp.]|nr:tetraacyldisaccharide 4'-kinase [Sulfurovum sp.]
MKHFVEQMFFNPQWYHYPFILVLFPFSLLYGSVMYLRRKLSKAKKYNIPIVSVGNLIVGGAGKTPFVIALASKYQDVFVISRGYGRQSTGFKEVSTKGKVLVDVSVSGDEAMLMAQSLPHASLIVSENRHEAIKFAQNNTAKLIILDDGFNRVDIEKFDILLEPNSIKNHYTFPAGPLREFLSTRKSADIIAKEGFDFIREVTVANETERMVLVTAISNPMRLDRYLPKKVIHKVYYDDHAYFDENILKKLLLKYKASSILCTSKDKVKMDGFKLAISEMKLKLEIKKEILEQINEYIEGYKNA